MLSPRKQGATPPRRKCNPAANSGVPPSMSPASADIHWFSSTFANVFMLLAIFRAPLRGANSGVHPCPWMSPGPKQGGVHLQKKQPAIAWGHGPWGPGPSFFARLARAAINQATGRTRSPRRRPRPPRCKKAAKKARKVKNEAKEFATKESAKPKAEKARLASELFLLTR